MKFRKTTLSASILAALALSGGAHAQTPAGDEAASELEAIVVQGIRESLKKSRDTKRDADAIVDAINAEDIGKFPDKNVAESLSHLPGITIDRDFGQGERVSIRGTDPALNRTLLNGQTIASADWFILDSPGRTFNYTLLAPEVVGRLEVYKTPEARIDEGSIGGTVILHTRNPLDLDPMVLNGSVGYGYNDRAEEGAPNVSGLASFKNDAGTVGFLVSLIRSEEELQREGIETFSYPSAIGAGFPPASVGNNADVVFPNAINAALFKQQRTRTGGTFGLQFEPSDAFELNVTGLYVKAEYDNFNQSRYVFNGWGPNFTPPVNVSNPVVNNGVVTQATFDQNALTLLDAIVREAEVKTRALNVRGDWYGDDWSLGAQVGTTKADGGTQQQYFLEFEGLGGYVYNIGRESASVDFVNDPRNASSLPGLGFAQLRQQPTRDEEQYIQADWSKNLEWGAVNQLLVGVKHREHETGQDARLTSVGGLAGRSLAQFAGGLTPDGFLDGIDANDDLAEWMTVDRGALVGFLAGVPENNAYREFPEAAFDVTEDITSGYAQINFGGDRWRGNFGARYVKTEQESRGRTRSGANLVPNEFKKSYNDLLPSLNFAYDLNDDVVLRLAGSRVIARPNFADLSSFTVLLDTVLSGNGGNPNLDPYRANNFDFSAEWYIGEDGLLAATLFHKSIASFIVGATAQEQQFSALTNRIETYDITRPRNGDGGDVKGFELMYQNAFGNGFGLMTNYTYSSGDTDEGLEIPFNSEHSFNVTPYYENERFSARVTYSWRDKYFRQIGRNGVAVTNDEYAQLDAVLGYKITDRIELTFEGLNLLDETQYQYAGQEDRPLSIYKNGRRYFVGVRFAF